jgi:hypothetical protein
MTRRAGRPQPPDGPSFPPLADPKWPTMSAAPPCDEEDIRAKARELHDATDGTGCDCGGKVPLEGVLTSGPWWQRGWYGLATAAIMAEHDLGQGKSGGPTESQRRVRRHALGVVAEALRGSGSTEHQANTAGQHVVDALIEAGLLRRPPAGSEGGSLETLDGGPVRRPDSPVTPGRGEGFGMRNRSSAGVHRGSSR